MSLMHYFHLLLVMVFCVPAIAASSPQPLTEADARLAHLHAREWIGQGQVPSDVEYYGADRVVTGVWAVRVSVRDRGVLLGRGEAFVKPSVQSDSLPLMQLVERAVQRALVSARQRLAERRSRAVAEGADPEQLKPLDWNELGFRLQVQVQIAYKPEPIELLRTDPQTRLLASFTAGSDGLVFGEMKQVGTTADSQPTIFWPGDAIAGNLSASNLLTAGLARQGFGVTAMPQLARPGGLPLSRFAVMHVVEGQAGMPPTMLQRGLAPLPMDEVTLPRIEQAAAELAEHLGLRIGTLRGTYKPSADLYEPIRPEHLLNEQLVACLALVRYLQRQPHTFGKAMAAAKDNWVQQMVRRFDAILEVWRDQPEQFDTEARALLFLCLVDWPMDFEKLAFWQQELLADLEKWADDILTTSSQPQSQRGEDVPLASKALLVTALATAYVRADVAALSDEAGEQLGRLLDAVFLQVSERPTLAALGWYMLAQDAAGQAMVQRGVAQSAWVDERNAAIADMVRQLLDRQIRQPAADAAYLLGGIDFNDGFNGRSATASWQTAYVLLALSDVLATQRGPMIGATDGLLAGQLAARFVMQLQFNGSEMFYVRNVPETRGGVRLSPGDNRLSIGPNAVVLLALTRFLDAAERMDKSAGSQ